MKTTDLNTSEFAPFYKDYIYSLGTVGLFEILTVSHQNILKTLTNLPEEKLNYSYTTGKWSIKEILQHLIDAERILSYRALRFSRNDQTEIPGYNEDFYVKNSNGKTRNIESLLKEFTLVRNATIALFESFSVEMLTNIGVANNSNMSVRALGFIIAGHQMHHLKVIKEKYL
ncbi:MAG: DinB family protein [Lutibacter sp.]